MSVCSWSQKENYYYVKPVPNEGGPLSLAQDNIYHVNIYIYHLRKQMKIYSTLIINNIYMINILYIIYKMKRNYRYIYYPVQLGKPIQFDDSIQFNWTLQFKGATHDSLRCLALGLGWVESPSWIESSIWVKSSKWIKSSN